MSQSAYPPISSNSGRCRRSKRSGGGGCSFSQEVADLYAALSICTTGGGGWWPFYIEQACLNLSGSRTFTRSQVINPPSSWIDC
jgi:hypothetical protein